MASDSDTDNQNKILHNYTQIKFHYNQNIY